MSRPPIQEQAPHKFGLDMRSQMNQNHETLIDMQ